MGPSTGEFLFLGLSSISFSVQGGQSSLSISSNLDWKASSEADWLHLDKQLGSADGSILISADKNTTGVIRTTTIRVESTNISEGTNIIETVHITQSESDPPHLEINTSSLLFDAAESNKEININSNVNWTISSDEDWILAFPSDGIDTSVIVVSVTNNTSLKKRTGLLSISDGATLSISIPVTQEGNVGTEVKLDIFSAIASTEQSGNEAVNTIDGILTNRWSGEGDGAYITLDLGAVANVSFLKAGVYKSSSRGTKFDILTSEDGITFTEALMDITSEVSPDSLIIFDFDNRDARYLRVVGHGNTAGTMWNSFTEFEIWGWSSGTSSIQTSKNGSLFQVIPNPSDGYFSFQGLNTGALRIFSLDGKEVYSGEIEESKHINSGLKKGIYLLQVRKDKEIFTERLIIR